ncbi:glycoside hydrolase family 19 protein [Gemmobacter lanyuensis]
MAVGSRDLGATPAQARYDTRADLGNTPARDGDGYLYRGRGPIQITGKANYRQYRDWCRGIGQPAPDFVAQPDMVLLDPWEGIAPIWYWETRGLNRLADANNLDGITRAINGGDNGQVDRRDRYVRAALVLLGYGPTQIREFQRAWSIGADGIAGPTTRATLHAALTDQPPSNSETDHGPQYRHCGDRAAAADCHRRAADCPDRLGRRYRPPPVGHPDRAGASRGAAQRHYDRDQIGAAAGMSGPQAAELAVGYARASVPDAIAALGARDDVLANLARAKMGDMR